MTKRVYKNLEELGIEPGPPPPERKKIAWPFMLSANLYRRLREKAAVDGTSISEAVSILMGAVVGKVDFPQLPEGAEIRMTGNANSKPTRYFIPIEVAEFIQQAQNRGYSNAYVCAKMIEKGFEIARHNNSEGSEDLHPGPLEGAPGAEVGNAEKEPESDDIPPIPAGGTPTV